MNDFVWRARRLAKKIATWPQVPDAYWQSLLAINGIWPGDFRVDRKGRLRLPDFDIPIPKEAGRAIVPCLRDLRRILADGGTLELRPAGHHLLRYRGVSLAVVGNSEVCTCREMFLDQIYRLSIRKPTVVMDVGMNVGLASLFFAQNPLVTAVYGFEPFASTYGEALTNFALNPDLADKITAVNAGLDDHAHTAEVPFNARLNNAVGLYGCMIEHRDYEMEKTAIRLEDAASEYRGIRDRHPDCSMLIKVDCEGSEKEIVPALCGLPDIGQRVAFAIETHHGCHDIVAHTLEGAGLMVFVVGISKDIAQIRATTPDF